MDTQTCGTAGKGTNSSLSIPAGRDLQVFRKHLNKQWGGRKKNPYFYGHQWDICHHGFTPRVDPSQRWDKPAALRPSSFIYTFIPQLTGKVTFWAGNRHCSLCQNHFQICTSRLPALKATSPHHRLCPLVPKSRNVLPLWINFTLLFTSYYSNNMRLYWVKIGGFFTGCLETGFHVLVWPSNCQLISSTLWFTSREINTQNITSASAVSVRHPAEHDPIWAEHLKHPTYPYFGCVNNKLQ